MLSVETNGGAVRRPIATSIPASLLWQLAQDVEALKAISARNREPTASRFRTSGQVAPPDRDREVETQRLGLDPARPRRPLLEATLRRRVSLNVRRQQGELVVVVR
jgi:hypothetical protein